MYMQRFIDTFKGVAKVMFSNADYADKCKSSLQDLTGAQTKTRQCIHSIAGGRIYKLRTYFHRVCHRDFSRSFSDACHLKTATPGQKMTVGTSCRLIENLSKEELAIDLCRSNPYPVNITSHTWYIKIPDISCLLVEVTCVVRHHVICTGFFTNCRSN